jgi:hypothetical protein
MLFILVTQARFLLLPKSYKNDEPLEVILKERYSIIRDIQRNAQNVFFVDM